MAEAGLDFKRASVHRAFHITPDFCKERSWSKGRMVGQVGGENPARHHLLKGLRGVSADLNAHSFFILGLESDSKLQEERITLHTSLRAIKLSYHV